MSVKAITKLFALASLSLYSYNVFCAPKTYIIDPTHTSVIASWNHFGFSNPTASLSGVSGTLKFDPALPENASVSVSIPINTIDSYVEKLNLEFLTADYFDKSSFPQATFNSTEVIATGENSYDVFGQLTIKGLTKPVVFHATLNKTGIHPMTKKDAIGFDAHTQIKRSDFGLGMYVPNVSDTVTIAITTEAQTK